MVFQDNELFKAKKKTHSDILKILFTCLILPMVGFFSLQLFLPPATWQVVTLHVMLESLGLFSGIALALFILYVNKRKKADSYLVWVASALLVMGILDGFHSSLGSGSTAGWLHSLAMLAGGFLFALVWLDDLVDVITHPFLVPAVSVGVVTILGIIIIIYPQSFPAIIVPNTTTFTYTGIEVNILAGLLFFIGAVALFRHQQQKKCGSEELFLAGFCILNGIAAILSILSQGWSASFWYWHLLRVSAYILLFVLIYYIYRNERVRGEMELQESSEKYRALVETVKDWIWEIDENGVYNYASPKIHDILGYEPEEIIGKTPFDLMPPDEAKRAVIEFNALVLERKPIVSLENMNIHKDGHLVILETSGLPFYSHSGAFAGYRGIDRDISERKRSEEDLFQAHEALTRELEKRRVVQRNLAEEKRLFIGGKTVVFKWRAEAGWPVEYVSPNVENQFGYSPHDFISGSLPFSSLIHPDDLERITDEVMEHSRNGDTIFEQEYRLRRKDGDWRWLYDFTIIVRDQSSTVTYYNGYVLDITERKQVEYNLQRKHDELNRAYEQLSANEEELRSNYEVLQQTESALRESEQKFRGIIDQSLQFIGLMSTDGVLLEANRSALIFAGIEESDVLGKYFWDTPWWTHSTELQDKLKDAVRRASTGETVRFEATHPSVDRNLAYIDFSLKPVVNSLGEIIFLIPEGRDITERKMAETRLSDSEGRYRKLFESSLDGLLVVDVDTIRIIDANPAIGAFLGKPRTELVGKSLGEIGLFVDAVSAEKAVTEMKNFRYLHYDDLPFNSPERGRRRIEFIGNIYSLHEKLIIQYTIRDITDRIQAEETLRDNAERNATLLRLNQMTDVSEKELMEFAFDEGIRLTGSKVGYLATLNEDETILTMQFWTRTAMEQCQISDKPIVYPVKNTGLWGEAVRQRHPIITNDYAAPNPLKKGIPEGHVKLIRHMNIPIVAGSQIVLVAGVGNKEEDYNETDVQQLSLLMEGMWRIIERKRAEEALRASEGHLRTLVQTLPDLIWLKDPDGVYLACNPMFERFFGAKEPDILGKTDHDFVDKDLADLFRERDRIAMEAQRPVSNEEWITFADDGHRALLETIKTPMFDHWGRLIGVLGIGRDITERKRAEDELKKYRDYLEKMVRQRTEELSETNVKLRQEISERIVIQEALNKRLVALTEPLESTNIAFSDLFNIDDIQKIQDAFADANHVASLITMPDGTPITQPSNFCKLCIDIIRKTEKGLSNCLNSDASFGIPHPDGPVIKPCLSGGLWDAGASIIVGGKHIANWLIGQVKNEAIDEEKILNYAREIDADENDFQEALLEVPVMSMEQFKKVANVLFLLANELSLKAYQNVQQARFITERRKAEEALINSERKLAEIINLLPDPTYVIDNTGIVIAWNNAIEEITGISSSEMIGKGNNEHALPFYGIRRPLLADLVLSPDEGDEQRYYPGILKEGDVFYVETNIPDLKGKSVTLWGKASPLYDAKGNKVGAIESIRDISEQKRIEEALIEAKERAEVANQAKSIFLSRMSHELRTPLNAILGFTQIFRKQPNFRATQKRQLDIMLGSGEHLLGLISDLLDVGKIEEQRIDLEKLPFNLKNAIKQVISVSRFRTEEKGLVLQQKLSPSLPEYVEGDERRLRQIVLNLLSNAVKFTAKGSVILQAEYDKEHGILCIEVTDTGIGISHEMHDAIFEPFTQITEPGRISEGTGLGLTITRQLVTLMGGTIELHSEPGKGSTFQVNIPIAEAIVFPVSKETKKETIIGYKGPRRSVLIVDDDQTNLAMLLSALEPIGFIVRTVDNGSDAILMATRQRPDLLLIDYVMPGMDGRAVIEALKEEPDFYKCRIIGISAAVSPGVRREEFIASCDDFVSKPVNIDLILEKIGILLTISWETAGPEDRDISTWEGGEEMGKIPPDNILNTMQDAAGKGDYDTIEHLLDSLEKEDPACGLFCSRMRTFIDLYDEEGIITTITRLREHHDEILM